MKKGVLFALMLVSSVATVYSQAHHLLGGKFQIREGEYTRFTQSNINYNLETEKFNFYDSQWQMLQEKNGQIASYVSTNKGGIDLFGWGTSGYQSAPALYAKDNSSYAPDVTSNQCIQEGTLKQHDWGYRNAIGSDEGFAYYITLNRYEWNYLMRERPNASKLRGTAVIKDGAKEYCGFVFLPDNWSLPLNSTFVADNRMYPNEYTPEEWAIMENAGAVFLPCAGYREGSNFYDMSNCAYWTSNSAGPADGNNYEGKALLAFVNDWTADTIANRYMGYAVRPVDLNRHDAPKTLTRTETKAIKSGETYTWNGVELDKTGKYTFTKLEVAYNTDSIITLNLTVGQGIDAVAGGNVKATKEVRNGQLFIRRGDKIYTVAGQEVK